MAQYYGPNQPQYHAPISKPAFKINTAGFIAILIIAVIIAATIFYDVGYHQGVHDYTHNNCSYYPFALISSSQYWACKIPQDQLPQQSQ